MEPITRIRQFIDADPESWVAECFRRYLHNAHKGFTLDQAFGLTVGPGRAPWWAKEAQRARDDAIRELADQHFGSLDLNGQANAVLHAIRRYRRGRWRFDRGKERMPETYVSTPSEFLYEALLRGGGHVPESEKHLLRILSVS